MSLAAPVESAAHIENPNAADWCDQAYQKVSPPLLNFSMHVALSAIILTMF